MLGFSGLELALVGLIALLAGFVQGLSGFGSALVAMPLLLQFLPARLATPFCILMGIVITSMLSLGLRSHLDWKKIGPIFVGCIPGIAVGTYFLKTLDNEMIKRLLGLILIGYSLFKLFFDVRPRRLSRAWGVIAGFMTGAIGAAFSAGGPPTIIYTSLNDWNKDEIKATLSGFFLLTGVLIAAAHAVAGITNRKVLLLFAVGAVPVVAGTRIGSRLYNNLSHKNYLRIIFLLLLMMGILLEFP